MGIQYEKEKLKELDEEIQKVLQECGEITADEYEDDQYDNSIQGQLDYLYNEKEKVQDTTYTFSYTANDPPKGFTTNITLFEYNEKGEQIVQNHVNNCKKGRSEKFTANTDSRKIKVYLVVTNGTQSVYNWVQQVYYLEKEKNIDVSVTGESRVGTKEP